MYASKKILLCIIIFMITSSSCSNIKCNRRPSGANGNPSKGSSRFRIVIVGKHETYVPYNIYTVKIEDEEGVLYQPNQFNGFTLTVEPESESNTDGTSESVGTFILTDDANTKMAEKCPNTLVHTSHAMVSSIRVQWRAPSSGSGCVVFKAAVMQQNTWFIDNGGLTLKMCELDDLDAVPTLTECCACEEAKYELKFEGLWTRQSHPKYFPANLWDTGFSDLIGASHSSEYRFWRTGEPASPGLRTFLMNRTTTSLVAQIKTNDTRTIIKAKGIMYPNIRGQTYAVFRVDSDHHMLSVISLLMPSPDWFVGLSGLELCLENCSWVPYRMLQLFPYDMGVYDEKYYTKLDETVNGTIEKIENSDDVESPFYSNDTENDSENMKPLGKIHLTLQRLYKKNCTVESTSERCTDPNNCDENTNVPTEPCTDGNCGNRPVVDTEREKVICKVTEWSQWSECSYPADDCERVHARFRSVINDTDCEKPALEDVRPCAHAMKNCMNLETLRSKCNVGKWPEFSPCDVRTCSRSRSRTRTDKNKNDLKCVSSIRYKQEIRCPESECQKPIKTK